MMQFRGISLVISVATVFLWFLSVPVIETLEAKPGGKGGNKPPPSEFVPMAMDYEDYFFRVTGEDGCLGEDDRLEWAASGSLAPGESFGFEPQMAGCKNHTAAITIVATWSSGALELRSQVPDADLASLDADQAGQTIRAPLVDQRAQLCMFPHYNSDGVVYEVTLTNNSSETVHDIQLDGKSENDWAIHFYPRCINADADNDGWNDSLEHSMTSLLYRNNYIDGVFQPDILWGSNYLRDRPQTSDSLDEIDSFPPDFNDDGRVDDLDLQIFQDWSGQGNGIPLEDISPNPGALWYHNNTLPWRRYDLDGDGFVDDEDRRILVQSQDQEVPMTGDSVSPTARVTAPLEGESVPRGGEVRIIAHAWDNSALTRVDYLVNGRTVCSKTDPLPGYGFTSPLYFCWWQVPKRNQTHRIEVRAYDATGNSNISRQIFVTSG